VNRRCAVTKRILFGISDQQRAVKNQELAEKHQHLRQQLAMKDQQIQKLYEDIESWREQAGYKIRICCLPILKIG
jgi:hypothetical protein